jgi:hypothetical protein
MHPGKNPGHRPAKSGFPRPRRCRDDEQKPFFHFYLTAERAEVAEKYMEKYIKLKSKSKFCLSFLDSDFSTVDF